MSIFLPRMNLTVPTKDLAVIFLAAGLGGALGAAFWGAAVFVAGFAVGFGDGLIGFLAGSGAGLAAGAPAAGFGARFLICMADHESPEENGTHRIAARIKISFRYSIIYA